MFFHAAQNAENTLRGKLKSGGIIGAVSVPNFGQPGGRAGRMCRRQGSHERGRQLRRPLELLFLLLWAVVERLSLIYDMDRQKLKCLVADNLESCVRYITDGDASISGRDRHLFAVR